MKAMILAAGYGTRLRPFTEHTPKPLFTIGNQPVIDILIQKLIHAGCEAIAVNTHHLHDQIECYLKRQKYPIPIYTRYEPEILGTGGGIRNFTDFWDDRPFMVVNGDVVTDLDFRALYADHLSNKSVVTMALVDDKLFNTVGVDVYGRITGFGDRQISDAKADKMLTFTGIQVINPEVIPDFHKQPSSSIDTYYKLLQQKKILKAFAPQNIYWNDIGTPDRYRQAVLDLVGGHIFQQYFSHKTSAPMQVDKLKGDGSDRHWYRLTMEKDSIILADHGIRNDQRINEAESFIRIGRHLKKKNIPVPLIYNGDSHSGLVFVEDLGDLALEQTIANNPDPDEIIKFYRQVIDQLLPMSINGAQGFDASWTYQTAQYDQSMILEKECRYFIDAFVAGYMGISAKFEQFLAEFEQIAEQAELYGFNGFMHRDLQSRNIMVKNGHVFFIDFQSGRIGPVQYDLASLLIDPYVALSEQIQAQLLEYGILKLQDRIDFDQNRFIKGYRICRITRGLQMLGAFGFLSKVKGKTYFEQYIPTAMKNLYRHLNAKEINPCPKLTVLVAEIGRRWIENDWKIPERKM